MEMMMVIVLRCIERLVSILIGGLCVWLGYRLFLDVQAKADSSGKFTLPGGSAIHLTRVGPGVFFALFGAGIVFTSFIHSVDFEEKSVRAATPSNLVAVVAAPSPAETELIRQRSLSAYEVIDQRHINGATQTPQADDASRAAARASLQNAITKLNHLETQLPPGIDQNEVLTSVGHLKQLAMKALWADDWGDYAAFVEWKDKGESASAIPSGSEKAVEFFTRR